MPALSITKTYQDGDILTEADLDNIRLSVENFINTTGIDSDNIAPGGVAATDIGINDSEFLEFGTGNDGGIGVITDDLYIRNNTSDKDIIVQASPGGVLTEIFRVDGSAQSVVMNSKKITGLANANLANNDEAVNVATLKAIIPPGSIFAYGAVSAPTGYLLCDGSAVNRTTYADLFTAIGETAGQGDNATTFNVPDLRGRFLRGWDNTAGRDPDSAGRTALATGANTGDTIFSLQDDEFKAHTHSQTGTQQTQPVAGAFSVVGTQSAGAFAYNTGSAGGSTETRPKNVYVNYIIKY